MIKKVGLLTLWVFIFVARAMNIQSSVQDSFSLKSVDSSLNYRPIIGILSQELGRSMKKVESLVAENYSSYIASSYVKFVESAGARVVPIMINKPDTYYEKLANSLNGFIFPGGSAKIDNRSGYGRAGKKIYTLVKEHGARGKPIPLWGTCLGFEMLALLVANDTYPLTKCKASNMADTLQLKPDYSKSKLFKNLPDHLFNAMQTTNITSNFHRYCVTPETFVTLKLNESLLLLTTTNDSQGIEYISTIEHKTLPMYGTQWHPEKAPFEWAYNEKRNSIPHNLDAIQLSQYMAETFIEEARKNMNHFDSEEEVEKDIIYNYSPVYIQQLYPSAFQQVYLFK